MRIFHSILLFFFYFFNKFHIFSQNNHWQILTTYPGTEDITWNKNHSIAFISCNERRKKSSLYQQNGKILAFYQNQILNLHNELPFPFHPHGLDFDEQNQQLYVINHRQKKLNTIEVFQFYPNLPQLKHLKTIQNSFFISPNDLYIINPDTFYLTNDPNNRSIFYFFTNFFLRLKTDKVILYENGKTRIFCKMNYPNGIVQIDNQIFISSIYKRRIEVYNLEGKRIHTIKLEGAPDNLELDEENNLWTAAHIKFSKFIKHFKDSTVYSPSKLYKITSPSSKPQIFEIPILEQSFSAASVAAPFQDTILIGCVFDSKILVGKLKK